VFLVFVHLVIDPLLLPVLSLSPALAFGWAKAVDESLSVDPALREQIVIVADIPDSMMLSYLPAMRAANGKPRPAKLYWLAATRAAVQMERRAPNVLRLTSVAGIFDRTTDARSLRYPFHRGDRVVLSDMTVEVVELSNEGRPLVCDFVFAEPLESSTYVWQTWRDDHLESFHLPALGQQVTFAAPKQDKRTAFPVRQQRKEAGPV
jgi:hypothetical protein